MGTYLSSFENERIIQKRFDQQLNEQHLDLELFKEQFAVYSNPFNIEHDRSFRKQVLINDRLIYWSDDFLFPETNFEGLGQYYYESSIGNGILLVDKTGVSNEITLISYLPITKEYPVKNHLLKTEFNNNIFINKTRHGSVEEGNTLFFKSTPIMNYVFEERMPAKAVYIVFGLLILSFGAGVFWAYTSLNKNRLVICSILIIISKFSIEQCITNLDKVSIFQPINYTSPFFGNSAGNLLLNSLVFLFLVFIFRDSLFRFLNRSKSIVASSFITILSLFLIHGYVELIKDVIENSQINLDINSSIIFDDIKSSLLGAIICSMLSLVILLRVIIKEINGKRIFPVLLLTLSIELLIFTFTDLNVLLTIISVISALALLIGFRFNVMEFNLDFKYFTTVVTIALGIACTTAVIIYQEAERDDLVRKQKFANSLLIHNDFTAELLLNGVMSQIAKDSYIRSRFLSNKLSGALIESRIRNEYLSPYFNKYALDIYLISSDEKTVYNSTQLDFIWEDSLERSPTGFPDIYLKTSNESDIPDKYLAEVPFQSIGGDLGKLVMVFSLKKFIPKSIYPQILNNDDQTGKAEFDYAVFKDRKMIYKRGKHPFEKNMEPGLFENSALYENGIEYYGHAYYGIKTSDGRVIIISSPLYSTQSILQNASFYFSLFLLVWLLILLIYISTNRLKLTLSSKIQISLSLSIFIPMIVVAIALLSTLSRSYKSEIDRNFSKRSFNMAESLIEITEKYLSGGSNQAEYASQIVKNAEIIQSDLNIYDINGRLLVSSQPQIFNKSLLSGLIEPKAINALRYGNEQGIILDRNIGETEFKSSYTSIRSYRDGKLLAYLSMPYFDSKNHLRKQQIEVFNNVTFIFTLIFLIAYFAENIFVGQLIKPLKKIAQKLSIIKLEESNERLDYEANDEIGQLVTEYNAMLGKLEDSKLALAESQKESAWKEIARQVAHEIKNPLTPMRLRIQQLMRSSKSDENQTRVLNSLIDQIDSLSSIADSFSAFATMPAPKNQSFEINSVIKSAVEVYQTEDITIAFERSEEETMVFADPKLFSRALTNIILNAIQAVKDKKPKIEIFLVVKEKSVLISIRDNGQGMSEEIKRNVFKPYFSTKSTGSGIGLAVAKKGIENAGGNIWFETKEMEGTTFFIKLPKK
ncbi:MAG: ATP-binding protein [Cyclobacteriaceae bacterium]